MSCSRRLPTSSSASTYGFALAAASAAALSASSPCARGVGSTTAAVKSYTVQVTDGKVDVDLDSVVDQAKISAIEVLPAG